MGEKIKKIRLRQWVLLVCALAITAFAVEGVYAFLVAKTQSLTNTFQPVSVTCAVEESFDGKEKKNVSIRNTGDIDCYIRAAVVVNWVDGDGKVLSAAPVEGVDYAVAWGAAPWVKGDDGFWYHCNAVAPDALTDVLIHTMTANEAPEGCHLEAQILATAVQAEPAAAAQQAWGVTVSDGALIPPQKTE